MQISRKMVKDNLVLCAPLSWRIFSLKKNHANPVPGNRNKTHEWAAYYSWSFTVTQENEG